MTQESAKICYLSNLMACGTSMEVHHGQVVDPAVSYSQKLCMAFDSGGVFGYLFAIDKLDSLNHVWEQGATVELPPSRLGTFHQLEHHRLASQAVAAAFGLARS